MSLELGLAINSSQRASSFSPLSFSDLAVWYDLRNATQSGGVLTSLPDSSPNAYHGASSGGGWPSYTASNASYGNKPTMDLPAVNTKRVVTPTLGLGTSPYTIFTVGSIGIANGYLCSADDTNDCAQIFRSAAAIAFSSSFSPGTKAIAGGTAANANVIVAVANGASSKLYVSANTAVATGDAGSPDLTGNVHYLGNYRSANTAFDQTGSTAQWGIIRHACTQAEVEQLLAFFGALHGITIGA
jgi:hypothetical protein